MADATTVKKKGRSKKVVEAADAEPVAEVETTVKKSRTRKSPAKESNAKTSESVPSQDATTAKSTATKKIGSSKSAAKTSTSKRTAKTSKDDVDLDFNASSTSSPILEEATAFKKKKDSVPKEMPETHPKANKSKTQLKQVGSIKVAPADESIATATTNPASQIKLSPFLSSFLNEPEPAPVPPAQTHQVASPQESRADLQQATRHGFEDSILTPNGRVKGSSSSEKPTISAVDPPTVPVAAAATTSQLRAFTTTSFAALRAGSKPSTSKPATAKPTKAGIAKTPKPTAALPSTPAPSPEPSRSSTVPSSTRPAPLQPPSHPAPNPPTNYHLNPSTPSPPEHSNLKRNPAYRSLNWRWFRLIVGGPFLIWTSYELWQRWERGELGGRDAITGGRRERELRAYQESLRRKGEGGGQVEVGGGGGEHGVPVAVEVGASSGRGGETSRTGTGIGIANTEAVPGNPASAAASAAVPNTTATANAAIDLTPAPWQSAYPTAREGFARPGGGFRF